MIIDNGTIEVKTTSGGGIDPVTRHPIPVVTSWGTPIACQWEANNYNALGRVNGEHFTAAQYTVLIEEQVRPFTAEALRLKDRAGNTVGEFSVISLKHLEAVNEIRILI